MMDMRWYKQYVKECRRAYEKISSIARIPIEDLVDRCLVLVRDGESPYYGSIGILENEILDSENHRALYMIRFGEKKKKVKFEIGLGDIHTLEEVDKKLFCTPNVFLLLEERDKIGRLFLD
ncbi:MAG: hypothetical protein AABX54_05005 [Nanoarchaeota archaeon]